jgi:cytochrome P450
MLAIPREDAPYLRGIAESSTGLIGSTAASWRDFRAAMTAMRGFDQYLADHIARLRRDDDGDSILADVVRNGDLTEPETRMLALLLLGAGFVTTPHVLGKAIVALVRHPEQLTALLTKPQCWPNAIEEILRYDTTGPFTGRIAMEPVEIEGYSLRAGESIILLIGGANRDPRVIADPGCLRHHPCQCARAHQLRCRGACLPRCRAGAYGTAHRVAVALRTLPSTTSDRRTDFQRKLRAARA